MLYLESPKGVGFSYCDNAVTSSECINDDTSTSQDAYEFLVNWFLAYPEFSQNKFYVTGESYAGIYIPMLMDEISKNSLDANPINLIGAAVGNGCWGVTVFNWYIFYLFVFMNIPHERLELALMELNNSKSTPNSILDMACIHSLCAKKSWQHVEIGVNLQRGEL